MGSKWKAQAWEAAVAAGLSHDALEQHFRARNPFLRKLVLHDLYVSHRCGELDSSVVGGGPGRYA